MKRKQRRKSIFGVEALIVLCVLIVCLGIVAVITPSEVVYAPEATASSRPPDATPPTSDTPEKNVPVPEHTDETPVPEEEQPEMLPLTTPDAFDDAEKGSTPDENVLLYVASMSLREKLCQMIIVTPDSITGVSGTTVAGSVTKSALEKYPVGGLVHFSSNITSGEQIKLFNTTVQSYVKTPLFIAADEEGGRVGRLKSAIGAHSVGAMLEYEDDGEETAFENACLIANTMKEYGFNTDFAPVADVWSNEENTVIGDRAYSKDFNTAASLVSAAVRGFKESGIVCSLKHFPGHGDTKEDSHNDTAYVTKTLNELRDAEFIPFAAGISAGADMVMLGHLVVSEEDDLPASLSKRMVSDILRDELGFKGIVITDSLAMSPIASQYSAQEVAVTAVKAGVDILLLPNGVEETLAALTDAVESGEISESHIDESVARIISLKDAFGIMSF